MTQRSAWRAGQLDVNRTSHQLESITMNDLHIIARQNAKATEASIPSEVAAGKHVVARYEGVNFFGHESFDTREQAEARAAELNKDHGTTTKIHSPEPALA